MFQILQKIYNLLFSVNISFSWLNFNDCSIKLYPDIVTVTTRPFYFLPNSPLFVLTEKHGFTVRALRIAHA